MKINKIMTKSYRQKRQEAHDLLNNKLSQGPAPSSELEIKLGSERFLTEFGMVAPAAYLEVMTVSNGIEGGGIKLWG